MSKRSYEDALADLDVVGRKAEELLLAGGISKPPVPANLISIFDPSRPLAIRERDLGVIRGTLRNIQGHWLIVINSKLCYGAQRFSLFHEGYHILEKTGALPHREPREYAEWLADAFAARLLMPREWVIEAAKKAGDVAQISGWFRVSQAAMSRRLDELEIRLEMPKPRRLGGY
jgi:hypothetical protein